MFTILGWCFFILFSWMAIGGVFLFLLVLEKLPKSIDDYTCAHGEFFIALIFPCLILIVFCQLLIMLLKGMLAPINYILKECFPPKDE